MTIDDLLVLTVRGQITWSRDTDPVAVVHGTTVFVSPRGVYARSKRGWESLGPSDDLRRAIEQETR